MACSVKRQGGRGDASNGKAWFSPQLPPQPDILSFTPAVHGQYWVRYFVVERPQRTEYYRYKANPFVCVPCQAENPVPGGITGPPCSWGI
jgi:hypothetical protein